MNIRVIKALLKKDLMLFLSNRFYMLITFIGLVVYISIYFVLPSTTDEKLHLAVSAPVLPPVFSQLSSYEGTEIEFFSTEELLKQAVLDGDYQVAVSLPQNIMDTWASGGKPLVKVYYASTAPPELSDAIVALVKELAYAQTGQALNFSTTEEVLGVDTLDNRIVLRDRMRPLLAIFILLVEILTLASLIAVEIEQGTARAILVTPLRISELFIAKGLLGAGLAFVQAVLFMILVGGFSHQPLIIFVTLIIGSIMVVGTGFLLASVARDVMAVTGWGVLILVLLAIPGFGSTMPGLISDWAKVIPSYYLTDTISKVANYSAGWGDICLNLAILSGFSVLVIWVGMIALRRRYR